MAFFCPRITLSSSFNCLPNTQVHFTFFPPIALGLLSLLHARPAVKPALSLLLCPTLFSIPSSHPRAR